jgi:outer membrane protein assembly factor BamB
MDAFDASTGTRLWTTSLAGQNSFSAPPTASNGVVYTSGAGIGGTLYAVDESSGAVLATQPVENGDDSSPALSTGGVFVQYACDQTYGFAQQTLAPLWHYSGPCEGGGGNTLAYAGGDVFTHDYYGNLILDAATGNPIRSWFPSGPSSSRPPAVDSSALFFVNQGALVAQDLATGAQKWSYPGDGNLEPQPIVLNTPAGEFVVIDSSAGNLYAVDAANGQLAWSGNLGTTIPNFPRLAAGQGLLVAPAGNVLTAYTGTTGPPSVTLMPADAVNTVGTSHTVTASVSTPEGGPVLGSQVLFSVQGSVTTTGSCTTDQSGACAFTYQGPQLPGADVITACVDSNGNNSADPSEPCATATKAWVAPTTTAGHVTGGGQVSNPAGTDNDAFGFTAQSDSNGVKGECSLVDPSANVKIKCLDVTTLTESGTHATLFGDAVVNGTATTYRIDVDDFAEPGAAQDRFNLQTGTGYTAGGILASGNIQVH